MEKYIVRVEDSAQSRPRPHEEKVANKIADIVKSDIIFIRRRASKTPDLYIARFNALWELKSPLGGSKHTIQNNLRNANNQSEKVILDLSRSKLTDWQGISRAKEFLRTEKTSIKKLKVYTKTGKLIDIK